VQATIGSHATMEAPVPRDGLTCLQARGARLSVTQAAGHLHIESLDAGRARSLREGERWVSLPMWPESQDVREDRLDLSRIETSNEQVA
jgi:hypothetical protein